MLMTFCRLFTVTPFMMTSALSVTELKPLEFVRVSVHGVVDGVLACSDTHDVFPLIRLHETVAPVGRFDTEYVFEPQRIETPYSSMIEALTAAYAFTKPYP